MPNFRPDTGEGGGGLLLRLLVPSRCREGLALLSPSTYAAQAPGCSMWSVSCVARGSSPRVFHKSAEQKAAPAFCAFPVRVAQAAMRLTGTLSPGAARLLPSVIPVSVSTRTSQCMRPLPSAFPAPVPARRSGACALCLAATLSADVDHPESQEVFG